MATHLGHYPEVGDSALDFTLTSLSEKPISLSNYRDKKAVVFMWVSWYACSL